MLDRIVEGWARAGGLLLLAIVLVTSANVAAFALDKLARLWGGTVAGLPGYEDFVSLAVSVAALSFLPYCQHRRGHVAVDLFVAGAPPGLRRALDCLWLGLSIAAALFLAWWMWLGLAEVRSDATISPVLGWPVWPFYVPGVVSLLLWAAVCAAQIAGAESDG
jgi:TRAP-type C4-dicarboxylate transport system permease small subunit